MTVIVAAIVGFLGGRMLWLAMRKSWNRQAFMRKNFQGVSLPTAAGIVLALTLLLTEAARAVIASIGIGEEPGLTSLRAAALVVVLGFTMLGLLDDLVGSTGARGFNGHFQALARGELTSGMIKLIGGATAAIVGASLITAADGSGPGFGGLISDALIIALTANLFNLLDLRPGRTTKVGIALFVVLALVSIFDARLVPVAIVVGAAAAILLDDLHERLMLGDTGANALGAAIGLGLATQMSGATQIVTLLVLIGLNVLSEFVSFSKLIDSVPPLRMLDQLGRRRPPVLDMRDEVVDAEPFGPIAEPFHAPVSTPPIPRTYPARGNVGGARDADATEAQTRRDPLLQESALADEPSDLFGVSEDDFDIQHELGDEPPLMSRNLGDRNDHRHN